MAAQVEERMIDPASEPTPSAPEGSTTPSFEDWVVLGGPGLMRFAVAVVGISEARDAVQDAMVAVYPRWRRLTQEGGPDAYARRVIINRRNTWWRRIGRRETLSEGPVTVADNHADAASDAVLAARLLRTLPVRQRAAVALRYYDDLDFAAISRILGCAESTARSHVHRALASLRTELGGDDD